MSGFSNSNAIRSDTRLRRVILLSSNEQVDLFTTEFNELTLARQILLVSKKRKEQLKNARKKIKIKNGIGDKTTKGEEGVAREAGTRGSGDGLGESACPEPQDETVSCCHETTSNNDDRTTGSLCVVVIIVLLSFL